MDDPSEVEILAPDEISDNSDEHHRAISRDPAMEQLLQIARQVARTPSTVLLTGESGAGKEIVARYIHQHSPRAEQPFVAVNCAALPASLLESELFGHEQGAFSGAHARHIGYFERACRGTILLDEISEIGPETQAKLLRVLQERQLYRVGGRQPVDLDVRVIATSNRDLKAYVETGEFRLDLYYRLNVFPLHIPPLRQRPGDIEALTHYYLARFARCFSSSLRAIHRDALRQLKRYTFPGNVRELVNILERAVILAGDSHVLRAQHLVLDDSVSPTTRQAAAELDDHATAAPERELGDRDSSEVDFIDFRVGREQLTDIRRKTIIKTLERFDGNRTHAARALGISPRTVRNKLRDYRDRGFEVPDPAGSNEEDD